MENVYGVHNIEFHLQWIILYSEKKLLTERRITWDLLESSNLEW